MKKWLKDTWEKLHIQHYSCTLIRAAVFVQKILLNFKLHILTYCASSWIFCSLHTSAIWPEKDDTFWQHLFSKSLSFGHVVFPPRYLLMSGHDQPHQRALRDTLNWWWLNLVAQPGSRHTAQYVNTTDGTERHVHIKQNMPVPFLLLTCRCDRG